MLTIQERRKTLVGGWGASARASDKAAANPPEAETRQDEGQTDENRSYLWNAQQRLAGWYVTTSWNRVEI